MTEEIREYFSDKENCFKEICLIREQWSNKNNICPELWDKIRETLCFMRFYCPEEVNLHLEVVQTEADMRERHSLGLDLLMENLK